MANEIDEGLSKAFSGQGIAITDDPTLPESANLGELKTPESIEKAKGADDKQEPIKDDKPADSSLTDPPAKTDGEPKKDEPIVSKTFEQFLEEKSGGKYKSYEELENIINTPKKNEYKSSLAEKIDAYVAQGGTEEDFLSTQSVDFSKMSPREIMEYNIQMEDPDMEEDEVQYELKKRYGIDNWKDKPEDYDEGSEPEEIRIAKLRFNRESEKAKAKLIEYQKQWSVPKKAEEPAKPTIDPAKQEKWNGDVKKAVESLAKVPLKIKDDKGNEETFDFAIEADEQKEITRIANELYTDTRNVWGAFKDESGNPDIKAIAKAIFFMRNSEKAMQFVAQQTRTKGAVEVVKDIKNVNFSPDGKQQIAAKKDVGTQIAEQFLANESKR